MDINNAQKAEILAHALPNIQMYRKKIIVVKYGGNAKLCLCTAAVLQLTRHWIK